MINVTVQHATGPQTTCQLDIIPDNAPFVTVAFNPSFPAGIGSWEMKVLSLSGFSSALCIHVGTYSSLAITRTATVHTFI